MHARRHLTSFLKATKGKRTGKENKNQLVKNQRFRKMKRQASAVNLLWPIKEDWAKERETMVTSRRDGLCENWLEGKKKRQQTARVEKVTISLSLHLSFYLYLSPAAM